MDSLVVSSPASRLGHGEAGLLAAGDQRLQPSRTLLVAAEHDDRVQAEDIHMDGGRTGKPRARGRDGLHHQCGFGHAQSGAAVFLRHGDAQPAVARPGRRAAARESRLRGRVPASIHRGNGRKCAQRRHAAPIDRG